MKLAEALLIDGDLALKVEQLEVPSDELGHHGREWVGARMPSRGGLLRNEVPWRRDMRHPSPVRCHPQPVAMSTVACKLHLHSPQESRHWQKNS